MNTRAKVKARHWAAGSLVPVIVGGALICLASYVLELAFAYAGIRPESTLLDNFILGAMGACLLAAYLRYREEQQRRAAVKARLALLGELNRRIRGPLSEMTRSVMLENREERLRCADEAMERLDQVLSLSLPAIGAATASRSLTLQ